MQKGDFSNLASYYTKYRPSYNREVVNKIINTINKKSENIRAVDVGAGTGIFTKCLIEAGIKDVVAVEPNEYMRNTGIENLGKKIQFFRGSGENTTLVSNKYDLVTMASSFHWPNTQDTLSEFKRILNGNGVFAALWNPRLTERSDSENEVQNLLLTKYHVGSRVSSGLSGITNHLHDILSKSKIFRSVTYFDAINVVKRSHEEYIGAWRSVNDIQAQLGKEKFSQFLSDVEKIIKKRSYVEVHYLTRAWVAQK